MTASSIFKAFLPSKARATNCTSQASQDGIHRTALPLISSPSAANQTHHIAAFCLLTPARAKKLFLHQYGQKNSTEIACTFLCLSISLFLIEFYLQNAGLKCSKQSLSPGSTSAFSLSPGQECCCACFFFLQLGQLYHISLHKTQVNYSVNEHSEHLQLNWEY